MAIPGAVSTGPSLGASDLGLEEKGLEEDAIGFRAREICDLGIFDEHARLLCNREGANLLVALIAVETDDEEASFEAVERAGRRDIV